MENLSHPYQSSPVPSTTLATPRNTVHAHGQVRCVIPRMRPVVLFAARHRNSPTRTLGSCGGYATAATEMATWSSEEIQPESPTGNLGRDGSMSWKIEKKNSPDGRGVSETSHLCGARVRVCPRGEWTRSHGLRLKSLRPVASACHQEPRHTLTGCARPVNTIPVSTAEK